MERPLDARGLACPLPALKAAAALRELATGDLLVVLATDPESPVDVGALAARGGHGFSADRDAAGTWRLRIRVGGVTIRRAEVGDARAMAGIQLAAWRAVDDAVVPDELLDGVPMATRIAQWTERLSEGGAQGLLAVAPEPVGFATVTGAGELAALFVAPERWGTGVGSALLEAALDRLRTRGAATVTVWHLEGNDRALRFYARHGFSPDGARRAEPRLGPHVRLRREL